MTTFLRAAIMLAVLVGLPAAWIHYGPLPPRAQRVVDRFVTSAKQALDWDRQVDGDGVPATETSVSTLEIGVGDAAPAFAGERPAPQASLPSIGPPASPEIELARRVEPLLAKLKELGVASYALEPWGGQRRLYRFHCEMPLAGNDQVTEQFEAISADAQQAVTQVVADVAQWHASRMVAAVR